MQLFVHELSTRAKHAPATVIRIYDFLFIAATTLS